MRTGGKERVALGYAKQGDLSLSQQSVLSGGLQDLLLTMK